MNFFFKSGVTLLVKRKVCVHSFTFSAPQAHFLPKVYTIITTLIDPLYTLFSTQVVQGVQLSSGVLPFVKCEL